MNARFGKAAKPKAKAGYTLVEVVLGTGVLGAMLAAFFMALGSSWAIVNTARQNLRATQILTQKTESVRLCTWLQLTNLPTSFIDYDYSSSTTNGTPSATYYGTISVGPPINYIPNTVSYYGNIDLVTISVVWTNYYSSHPVVHNRQTQTLVAYYGLVNYIYGTNFVQVP
jgi:type II secretory pathway pseudopilin PulG